MRLLLSLRQGLPILSHLNNRSQSVYVTIGDKFGRSSPGPVADAASVRVPISELNSLTNRQDAYPTGLLPIQPEIQRGCGMSQRTDANAFDSGGRDGRHIAQIDATRRFQLHLRSLAVSHGHRFA